MLFLAILTVIVFGSKTVADTQSGMSAGTIELNQSNDFVSYISIANNFFTPTGFLLGSLLVFGIIMISMAAAKGISGKG